MAIGCGFFAGFLMTQPLKLLGVVVPDKELFNDRLFFGEAEDTGNIMESSATLACIYPHGFAHPSHRLSGLVRQHGSQLLEF